MGVGKTTVGRALARRLLFEFFDSDKEIELRTGVSIPTIFDIEGEQGFRDREAKMIEYLAGRPSSVVATGGGAVLYPSNRERMKKNGFVIYLNAPPETLWERLRNDRTRPLLQVSDPLQRLKDLHAQRDPLYRETAHLVVDCARLNSPGVLQLLTRKIGELWKH